MCAVLAGALLWSAGRPVNEDEQCRLRTFVQLTPGVVTREQAEAYRRRLHPHLAAASYVLSAAAPGTLLAEDPGDPVPGLLGVCLTVVVITGMGQVRASPEVGDHPR